MSDNIFEEMAKTSYEKHPAVVFLKLGHFVEGVLTAAPRKVNMPNMNDPSKTDTKFVFDLQTLQPCWVKPVKTPTDPDPEEVEVPAGTVVTLWSKGQMNTAIVAAVKAAGATDIREGAKLLVKFTEKRPIEGKPKPQKIYTAEYAPPVASMATAELDLDDDDE